MGQLQIIDLVTGPEAQYETMNVQTICLEITITSITANVQQTASITSGTMINGTDLAYCTSLFKSGSKLLVLILKTACRFESEKRSVFAFVNLHT